MRPHPQFSTHLATFNEEILNEKTSFFVQWLFSKELRKALINAGGAVRTRSNI